MKNILKVHSLMLALFINHLAVGQQNDGSSLLQQPKRFIDRVEIFAGTGFCFNYGNLFVENYRNENIENVRLTKIAYSFGVGVYHPLGARISIGARLSLEEKGTNSELNVPLNPVNDDTRVIINSEYAYRYLTLTPMCQIRLGRDRKIAISVGGYFSRIKQVMGYDKAHVLRDNTIEQGRFKARLFRDLRDDGGVYTFTWMNGLTGIQENDYGATVAIGCYITIGKTTSLMIRMVDRLGLVNINKDNPYGLVERNHIVSLEVAYTLQRLVKKKIS